MKNWLAWWPGKKAAAMRQRSVQCVGAGGLHRMAYVEWGDPRNPRVLMCVHGLTRNARDFDDLARDLARDYRVVCPDVVGRGQSDWLKVKAEYAVPRYVADMVTLIARLDVESLDWVGTSMGGIIGMALAADEKTPLRRLVLNDVGAVITLESLKRIGEYVGRAPAFPDFEAAEAYIRQVSASFGPLTAEQWRHLTEYSLRRTDGGYIMAYDPSIGDAFRVALQPTDIDIWPFYDRIRCPTLVIRGAQSDLLSRETAEEMSRRGPHARVVEIPAVGHAPALMEARQIAIVRQFLCEAAAR